MRHAWRRALPWNSPVETGHQYRDRLSGTVYHVDVVGRNVEATDTDDNSITTPRPVFERALWADVVDHDERRCGACDV